MKNITLLILFFISCQSYSQETEWFEYQLDSIVSVKMPGEDVYQLDSIINGVSTRQIYTNIDNSAFIVQRTLIQGKSKDKNLFELPYDKKSLIKFYNGFAKGISNSRKSDKIEKTEIRKDSFIGMKIKVYNSNNYLTSETDVFIFNEYSYSFTYFNQEAFSNKVKNKYLNSKKINNEIKISQFRGISKGYRTGYIIGRYSFYLLLLFGFIFFIYKLIKKK